MSILYKPRLLLDRKCDLCGRKKAKKYPIEGHGYIFLCLKCFEQSKNGGIPCNI